MDQDTGWGDAIGFRYRDSGAWAGDERAGLQAYRDNIEKLRDRVTKEIRSSKGQADIAMLMETEYQWAPNSLEQQIGVPGLMTELK